MRWLLFLISLVAVAGAANLTMNSTELANQTVILDDGDNLFIPDLNAVIHVQLQNFTFNATYNFTCNFNGSNQNRLNEFHDLNFSESFFNYDLNVTARCPAFPRINEVTVLRPGDKVDKPDYGLVVFCANSTDFLNNCPVQQKMTIQECKDQYNMVGYNECPTVNETIVYRDVNASTNGSSQSSGGGELDTDTLLIVAIAVVIGAFFLKKRIDAQKGVA